jgi:hypothetical protein
MSIEGLEYANYDFSCGVSVNVNGVTFDAVHPIILHDVCFGCKNKKRRRQQQNNKDETAAAFAKQIFGTSISA